MNKEQIEEMAKKMKQCYEKYGLLNFKWFAEAIYNAGYRKVPECAIILTKEEYDKLGLFEETVQEYKSDKGQPVLVKERKTLKKYPTDIADFIRKETAKEILSDLLDLHNSVQDINQKTDFYCSIEQFIAEIEIKYDIEVEE